MDRPPPLQVKRWGGDAYAPSSRALGAGMTAAFGIGWRAGLLGVGHAAGVGAGVRVQHAGAIIGVLDGAVAAAVAVENVAAGMVAGAEQQQAAQEGRGGRQGEEDLAH